MDQSVSAFLIGAGIGAYGFLCGNKAFQEEIEAEKTKRRNLLAASREDKFSLQKQLQAKDEEIASLKKKEEELTAALTGEQAKVQAYVAEKKTLKSMNAQNNNEIMELKLKLKDSESVVSKQATDISKLEAALKTEQEKVADLQIQLNLKTQGKVNVEVTELVATVGGVAAAAAVQEGSAVAPKPEGRRSFPEITKTTEWESDIDINAVIRPSKHRSRRLKASERIAWGQPAKQNQFQFAAYFQGEDFMCSGSLIAPFVVLTAGHCVRDSFGWINKTQTAVYIGSVNWNESSSYKIQAIYIPKYSEDTDYGDIALLHLASPVPSSVALPVALASSKFLLSTNSTATVLGWGETQTGKMPTMLMYTTESVLNKTICDKYHELLMGGLPPPDHICFGLDKSPSTGTCGGDSGGPFIVNINPSGTSGTSAVVQVAIVSYGPVLPCGDQLDDNLDVATSVMYWRTWIEDMLSIHNMRGRKKIDRINVMESKKCFEQDPDWIGEEERKKILTLGNCCDACRALKACKSWTWTEKTKSCVQGMSKTVSKASSDCISGSFL